MNMMTAAGPATPIDPAGLTSLVSTIGDDGFGSRLFAFLYQACGADYCTVYQLEADAARLVASASFDGTHELAQRQVALYNHNQRWRRDPMIAETHRQLEVQPVSLVQMAVRELPGLDYRDVLYDRTSICDRVLLCGRSSLGTVGLSLLRRSQSGAFSGADLVHLREACPMLMAIVDKHVALISDGPHSYPALTSLEQIEACLATARVPLSRREAEVCARILYGMSSIGIALELHIGEETVTTYRKRMYQRLGFATQRELLLWYLDLWGAQHGRGRRWLQ